MTGLAFGLTGVLTIGFTILWTYLRGPVPYGTTTYEGSLSAAPTVGTFLLVALVVPIVGEAIRQIGPVLLASRPEFDDLMDGLTFGVISGVAYSCFDTLVRHWDLLTGGLQGQDPGLWVSLIFLEGFVKPLIIGTATGIACAEFSGLGRGYDGFTPRYFRGVGRGHPGQRRLPGRHLPVLLRRQRDARCRAEHSLGPDHPGDLDPAGPQRAARRPDGGRAGAICASWCRRGRRAPVLCAVRDATAGACRVLQRLRHRSTGATQGRTPQDGGGADDRQVR